MGKEDSVKEKKESTKKEPLESKDDESLPWYKARDITYLDGQLSLFQEEEV